MQNYSLKLAIRTLLKQKSFTLVSLGGLATALAASIVVLTYYFHEIAFDKHIPDAERCYRIISRVGEGRYWSRTFAAYGDALEACPQVENYTSFVHVSNSIITVEESEYTISESVLADTAFIDFFGVEVISGRKEDLGLPNQVFLTEDLAETIFPGEDPLGREIFLRQFNDVNDSLGHFRIAGILKALPDNTHFGFAMVFSQQGLFSDRMKHIKANKLSAASVYVRLYNEASVPELEAGLIDLLDPYLRGTHGPPMEAFNAKLQAVRKIHFTPDIQREARPVTRKAMLYLLLSVGLLILVLMILNFTSMVLVHSQEQSRASRIMRILGADKSDLVRLSLFKISILVLLSLAITWILISLSEPMLQSMFGSSWSFQSLSRQLILVGLGAGLLVIVLTSLGSQYTLPGTKGFSLFGSLTVIQFSIVILLLSFSLMVNRQIRFLDQKDLGYTGKNVIITRIPGANPSGSLLVEEMEKQAGVISATTAHYHPADVFQSMDFDAGGQIYQFGFRMVDEGIFETLEIDLIRRFGPADGKLRGWVINESFYKELLLEFSPEEVAASNFSVGNSEGEDTERRFEIAGVMNDFHFSSLHNQIGNFAFVIRDQETNYNRWLLLRFSEGQKKPTLKALQLVMESYFPGQTFAPFLLEDKLAEQYANSQKLSRAIRLFVLLSILIAISGLYGLAQYLTRKRTKEIGIRKIHGAETRQIIGMLNLGYLKWIGIAFILACPLTLLALQKWLVNFAYRTALPWWIFILPGILVACIALVAVTWQTFAAASLNPKDTISIQ